MTHSDKTSGGLDAALDAAFDELRAARPHVNDALMVRMMADAAAMKPRPESAPARKSSWFANLTDLIGGWGGGLTLTAATAAGMALGIFDPTVLDTIYNQATGGYSVSTTDTLSAFLTEIDQ